jgi:flagellar motor switch protein FliM
MAAQSSSSNKHGKNGSSRRRSEPRTFDFRRPSKLSREHVRTMQIVQETFARGLATMLSSTLRSVSTVSIRSIEQQTYDEYVREVPNPTLLNILSLAPLSGAAILQLPLEVAFCAVELLLGGKGYAEQPARPFTDLELQLTKGIIERALPELRYAFEPVVATEPKVVNQESNPQFAQIAAPTDMVIVVSYDIKIESVSGIASLCIPFSSLQPHLEALSATSLYAAQSITNAAENRALINEHIAGAPVEVSTRFRPVVMSTGDILALCVGDVVPLSHPVDVPLMLTVGDVPTFEATIGRRNRRVAVQVVGPAEADAPSMRPSHFRRAQPGASDFADRAARSTSRA